jgi:hypothetical protein
LVVGEVGGGDTEAHLVFFSKNIVIHVLYGKYIYIQSLVKARREVSPVVGPVL